MDVNLLARTLESFRQQEAEYRNRAERLAKIIQDLKSLYPAEVAQVPKLALPGPVTGIEAGSVGINGRPSVCQQTLDPAGDAKIESLVVAGTGNPEESTPSVTRPVRSTRKGSSKYFGVTFVKRGPKCAKPWKANVWDRSTKKNLHIGFFAVEELAAAAVQSHLGNHAAAQQLADMADQVENNPDRQRRRQIEAAAAVQSHLGNHAAAQQLADMAEQVENNPDRQRRRQKEKEDIPDGSGLWECQKCCKEYESNKRPEICKCGNQRFEKINRDGSGPSDYRRAPSEE